MANAGSQVDPYVLTEYVPSQAASKNVGNYNLTGKTRATASGIVLVIFGQSNTCNVCPTAYTPGDGVFNFCIYDGATYISADPQLGCSGAAGLGDGNAYSRLADLLTGDVTLVPAGVGGSSVAQWEVDAFNRISATAARLSSRGLTASAILWQQGESDLATPGPAYQASLVNVITKIRAAFGADVLIFIAKSSWANGSVSTAITTAQGNVVNPANKVYAGPDMDTLDATKRQADNTHLNDAGAADLSALWLTALQAYGAPFI